MLSDLKKSIS